MAPRAFVTQFLFGTRYQRRESHDASESILGLEVGGADLDASSLGRYWLVGVFSGGGAFEDKAGSSTDSWLSSTGTLFGIGEGETDREVALLP